MSTNAIRNEQIAELAATQRAAEMMVLADQFCKRMAANNFELDQLPVTALEKLRNAASAMETCARSEIVKRCREAIALFDPTAEAA